MPTATTFFHQNLRLEKTVWSNLFRFINFPLQNTVPRDQRWTEPKQKLKIKKRQLITSYADSLLFLLDDKEHIILPKLQDIERIEKKEAALELKIKQFKYVIENMHDEAFVQSTTTLFDLGCAKRPSATSLTIRSNLAMVWQHTTQAKETLCLKAWHRHRSSATLALWQGAQRLHKRAKGKKTHARGQWQKRVCIDNHRHRLFFAQLHVQLGSTLRARLRLLQPWSMTVITMFPSTVLTKKSGVFNFVTNQTFIFFYLYAI